MRVILLGAPGSGKGTYASRLKINYEIPHISMGDILRSYVEKNTELSQEIKKFLDRGELVPDEFIVKLLKERFSNKDLSNGFFLDGFPRTLEQAKLLDKITNIDLVLYFFAEEKTLIWRLSSRRTCKNCSEIYNTESMPTKKKGICDKCGGEIYQRDDALPEVIKERLKIYNSKTAPLIKYYRKKGLLKEINANINYDEPGFRVIDDCIEILDEYAHKKILNNKKQT